MIRRLVLVGLFVLVARGSISQLVIGTTFCAAYMALQMHAWPYRGTPLPPAELPCEGLLLEASH